MIRKILTLIFLILAYSLLSSICTRLDNRGKPPHELTNPPGLPDPPVQPAP